VRRWVVGAPAYFARRGTPQRPRDLKDHACLTYSYLASGETWRFTDSAGVEEAVAVKGPLSATNAEALDDALAAGVGIALQPDFLAWEAVRDGRLVAVLGDWTAPPLALNILTPPGGPRAPRVSVVLDFLVRRFTAGSAPWTVGFPAVTPSSAAATPATRRAPWR
jgi:DNA-binding transcriptional LysR family regulator